MGKTNQPLVIWVAHDWIHHDRITELRAKGHTVVVMDFKDYLPGPDLILHPAAFQWSEAMWQYLEVALKAARKRKKAGKKK